MIHYESFHAQNPDHCVQSCNQNFSCQAITFYHDSGYEGDNCFHFNSRNNYYTITDPDKQYGVWKKDASFECKEQKSKLQPVIFEAQYERKFFQVISNGEHAS